MNGRVVDLWMHPVVGIPVGVAGAVQVTDQSGRFTFTDVPETYDASLVVSFNPRTSGWVYRGLTRRDPTLQVFQAYSNRSADFHLTQTGGTWNTEASWYLAFGGVDGARTRRADSSGIQGPQEWEGPTSTTWSIHSLFYRHTEGVPTGYTAYAQRDVIATANVDMTPQVFDLSQQPIATSRVNGMVMASSGESRLNYVFVRFTSGASLPVVDGVTPNSGAYDYLVPNLANSSITIAASESKIDRSLVIVHRGGLAAGPVEGIELFPAPTATYSLTAGFGAVIGEPATKAYVVVMLTQGENRALYVVTTTPFTLDDVPVVNDAFLTPGAWNTVWVETHGTPDDVDAMAGPDGFIDDFWFYKDRPAGSKRSHGAFGQSALIEYQTPL